MPVCEVSREKAYTGIKAKQIKLLDHFHHPIYEDQLPDGMIGDYTAYEKRGDSQDNSGGCVYGPGAVGHIKSIVSQIGNQEIKNRPDEAINNHVMGRHGCKCVSQPAHRLLTDVEQGAETG